MTADFDNKPQPIRMQFGPELTQPCGTLHSQDRAEQAGAGSASAYLTTLRTATGPHHPPRTLPRKLQVGNCFPHLPAFVEPAAQGVLFATNGTLVLTQCAPTQDGNTGIYVSIVAMMQGWLTKSTKPCIAPDAVAHPPGRRILGQLNRPAMGTVTKLISS